MYESIDGYSFPSVKFEKFIPDTKCVFPENEINTFMSLGPFVLETDGAFETEYFYEREKTLDCDYIASSGGEKNEIPYLGKAVINNYYGEALLKWKTARNKWGAVRFDSDTESCVNELFLTEQRNCVFYAAVYIECEEARDAVIVHETSGCKLFLNGELIDNRPYGRVKGLVSYGCPVAAHFNKGRNLLMFKIRTGYIADSIDMTISKCLIYPIAVKGGNFGLSYPQPTAVYAGTREKPLQLFECYAGAFGEIDKGTIEYKSGDYTEIKEYNSLKSGCGQYYQIKIPSKEKPGRTTANVRITNGQSGEADILFDTLPAPTWECTDYRFADFHFDTTYHQEQRTYAMGALYITKCMVEKLADDPDFKAVLSEVDYLHAFYSVYPQYRDILRTAFIEGRAEADCFYNQPNELTSSGEGFVRNLIYGQLYHRDVLGRITSVYAPGDVFGHPNQLSQICLKGGCRSVKWGKFVLGLDYVFRHVSPDGTVALHDKGIIRDASQRLGLHHASGGAQLKEKIIPYPSDGKTGWMKETLNHAHYAVFSEMSDGMLRDIEAADAAGERYVEINSRDLTHHHSGVLLTRTDFKQANRLAENLLITAEKFSVIANYYGAKYPDKAIDKAWRQLLCAQHHDSVTGTNNEVSFVDLMEEYREACDTAAAIVRKSCEFISAGIKTQSRKGLPYIIFNPHAFDRRDCCEIGIPAEYAAGAVLVDDEDMVYPLEVTGRKRYDDTLSAVFTASVPSLGYKTYYLKKKKHQHICTHATDEIENEFYKIKVDPKRGGGIVSVFDKCAQKEVIGTAEGGIANRIAVLREIAERMETQHEFYTTGQKLLSSDYPANTKTEINSVFSRITVEVKLGTVAKVRQLITLYNGVKRIDMQTIIEDYQSKDDLFTLTFPVDVKGAVPVFDDRFAPHVWGESRDMLSFRTHQYAAFSHCKIAPVNQWLEYGGTVRAVLKNGKKTAGAINIGETAIIRTPDLFKQTDVLLFALSKKGIPVTPYSDTEEYETGKLIHFNEDLDNTSFRFVLSVEGTENKYENKLLSECGAAKRRIFNRKLEENGYACLYKKDADNIYKKPIDVMIIKAKTPDVLSEILGKLAQELIKADTITFDGAVAVQEPDLAENYGVALFNRGNISCSVEPGGVLNMMLFHTAKFYGNAGRVTGEDELVPENKTHSFSYALYPHSGDYRQAKVYNEAFSFNDTLISTKHEAAQSIKKQLVLPSEKSFLRVSDGFSVTLMKCGDFPFAKMKTPYGGVLERGIVLRGFENEGGDKRVKIETELPLESAELVDLLEENARVTDSSALEVVFDCGAHSIETIRVKPSENKYLIGGGKLADEREPVEPTYVRSWEHDKGSMSMGYLSVAGIIGKDVKKLSETEYLFNISMANNSPDKTASGEMCLVLPQGFSADKTNLPYEVMPNGCQTFKVTVKKPYAKAEGIMRLNYINDTQQFEDIYEFGYFNPQADIKAENGVITVGVLNTSSERIYGELSLVSPFEAWNVLGFNSECRIKTEPACMKFNVKPGERCEYVFTADEIDDGIFNAYWIAAKLAANGRIHFAYTCVKGPRHNEWAHILFNTLFGKDRGSIKRLLEME